MNRVVRAFFFARDLLTAEQAGEEFVQKGITFSHIMLSGKITKIELLFDEEFSLKFIIYTVDDGTQSIRCTFCTEDISPTDETHVECKALKVGDEVKLFGILKQNDDLRYVYIDRIKKIVHCQETMDNMKACIRFYEFLNYFSLDL